MTFQARGWQYDSEKIVREYTFVSDKILNAPNSPILIPRHTYCRGIKGYSPNVCVHPSGLSDDSRC